MKEEIMFFDNADLGEGPWKNHAMDRTFLRALYVLGAGSPEQHIR